MKFFNAIAATALLSCAVSQPAQAGLIGGGGNTVSASFFLGTHTGTGELEDVQTSPGVFIAGPVIIGAGGVDFVEGSQDLSTIHVGDTTIDIVNLAPPSEPFCTVSTGACPDTFTGFEFKFSAGVAITGVTVDPASDPAFLPVPGGLTFTPTDILVNVAGVAPAIGGHLTLDLQFTPVEVVTPAPEPATLSILASGLLGLLAVRRGEVQRRWRRIPRTRPTSG